MREIVGMKEERCDGAMRGGGGIFQMVTGVRFRWKSCPTSSFPCLCRCCSCEWRGRIGKDREEIVWRIDPDETLVRGGGDRAGRGREGESQIE
jgi:hypothetical protein